MFLNSFGKNRIVFSVNTVKNKNYYHRIYSSRMEQKSIKKYTEPYYNKQVDYGSSSEPKRCIVNLIIETYLVKLFYKKKS